MPRVWDTASRGGDVLPGLWHEHRSGIIDTSGQHSRAAVYPRRTDSNAAADSASPTVPARHWHFPFGTIVAAVILVAAFWMLFTNYENR